MRPREVEALKNRLRWAYELARLRSAFLSFAPMLALIVLAAVVGGRLVLASAAGALLFVLGVASLWYGREPGRGVFPGAVAGSFALVLALCANHMGHWCTGDRCLSWCLPACVAGGLIAGGLVSFVGLRQKPGIGYWVTASSITLLTGALGCSCVGFAGIGGLCVGFIAAVAASFASSLRGRQV